MFNVFKELGQCHVFLQQHDASDKQDTDNLKKQVEDLNNENWVAYCSNRGRERPLIGRVLKVKENSITLGWLIGGYKCTWSDWKRAGKHQTQEIPLEDILMKIEFVENKENKKLSMQ